MLAPLCAVDDFHFYGRNCRQVCVLNVKPIVPGIPKLGLGAHCTACGLVAFTMLQPARVFCAQCDDVRPGLLKSMGGGDARVLLCSVCLDAKATLYEIKRAKPRA